MGVGFEGLVWGGWLIGGFHAIHCIRKFVPVRCLGSGVRRYRMLLYARVLYCWAISHDSTAGMPSFTRVPKMAILAVLGQCQIQPCRRAAIVTDLSIYNRTEVAKFQGDMSGFQTICRIRT